LAISLKKLFFCLFGRNPLEGGSWQLKTHSSKKRSLQVFLQPHFLPDKFFLFPRGIKWTIHLNLLKFFGANFFAGEKKRKVGAKATRVLIGLAKEPVIL
jgi:hypothetical protein